MKNKNNLISENIKFLRNAKKLSQEALSKELDIKRSTLSGYENNSSEPSIDMLIKLSNYFHVTVDQLIRKDLTNSNFSEDLDLDGKDLRILVTTVNQENDENIEMIPEKAKAGYRNGYADPEYLKVLPTFQLPFLSKQKKYRSFPISGDSMPPVSHGSYVVAEYLQNWNAIKDGQPYIIITKDDGIVFKIVYNKIFDERSLMLCSTNPFYEPYHVPITEVLEVWKFVNYICPELPEPNLTKEQISGAVMQLQKDVSEIKNTIQSN